MTGLDALANLIMLAVFWGMLVCMFYVVVSIVAIGLDAFVDWWVRTRL